MINKPIRKSMLSCISVGIACILAGGVIFSDTALAQEAQKSFTLDEIVVTGTRIRGADTVGASVIGIDLDDIVDMGGVTIDRTIKELPQVFDLGVSESPEVKFGAVAKP